MVVDQADLYGMLKNMAIGDSQACSEFYAATITRIFGVIIHVTGNQERAEAVATDVYLQAWRTAASYDAQLTTPLSWLVMIARTQALAAMKPDSSATESQPPGIAAFNVPDEIRHGYLAETLPTEKTTKLDKLLGALNATEREMITLAFYRGMSHSEIAHHMDQSLHTVKATMQRAQVTLKNDLR